MDINSTLRRLGGAARYRQLLALGVPRRALDAAVRRGDLVRPRTGWYALPSIDDDTMSALRVGGAVSCISLLDAIGVWVPPHDHTTHVAIPRNATGRLLRTGTVVHWADVSGDADRMRDTVVGAIRQLTRCFGREIAVAAADSALRCGVLKSWELVALPADVRWRVDPRCESGGESIVRQRLQALRLGLQPQVAIADVGRVDFVVGDRLVIEVDGYAYHGSREAFERDRARDLALVEAGYVVIRVSQRQVLEDWPRIKRAVLAVVRSDRHRWPRGAAVHSEG